MSIPNGKKFFVSGSTTISLSGDVNTEGIYVREFVRWSIEPVTVTGLDGSPTWTLEACNTNVPADFRPYDETFAKDLGIATDSAEGVWDDGGIAFNYFRIAIQANDNTTGTTEFLITYS